MEQVEGGDLIVNRGEESHPKDSSDGGRDFNSVEGLDAAVKLAQVGGIAVVLSTFDPSRPISTR